MTPRILSLTLGAVLLIAPAFGQDKKPSPTRSKSTENSADRQSNMSSDMQAAIAWERHKEAAAARQARIEARHPSVTNNANRSADEGEGKVKDEKAPGAKPRKDK